MRPLLVLEINEIPWRVIDLYSHDKRYSAINDFFSRALTFTTFTVDKPGMMDPWVTWPSLHRGMSNTSHNVKNLGQDPTTFKGVPIWEEFRNLGHSIGICGSMQSWPPLDPGPGGFYIPDTFAHDASCIPAHIQPFQSFNLNQVARNGRVVNGGGLVQMDTLKIICSMPSLGISTRTIIMLILQLFGERIDPSVRARRPIFQAILMWDIFRKLYQPKMPPTFSTFFTNHVAGIMHRYWKHIFPEDFDGKYDYEPKVHLETMDFAMRVLNDILAEALNFTKLNPDLVLVFATSMGQGPIKYNSHNGYETSIFDPSALMHVFGLDLSHYKPLLAMAPQAAVEISNISLRKSLITNLESARTLTGNKIFVVLEMGISLSITSITPSLEDIKAGGFFKNLGGALVPWNDAGIAMNKVDPGTAYHIPEGVLAVVASGITSQDTRSPLPVDQVKEMLIGLTGLKIA
jgi:hypothetical protein